MEKLTCDSARPVSGTRSALTSEEWERRFVAHYLRSDGPLGGGTLRFLDATPAEIAIASNIDGITEDAAQRQFLDQFDVKTVAGWLSGEYRPATVDSDVPGYFRFLVLTCLVTSTESGAGASHNFRIRLGELLGLHGPLNQVFGVNELWCALRAWCDRRRTAGHPIKKIELPPYGSMRLIGYAIGLAFPSWDDRRTLTRVLRSLDGVVRASPVRLVQELSRPVYAHTLPTDVVAAFEDFACSFRAGGRLLAGHRFWRLVRSIEERLELQDSAGARSKWRLCGHFGGYEQDDLCFRLFRGPVALDRDPTWEGTLQQLEDSIAVPKFPRALVTAVQRGAFVLAEASGALWVMEHTGFPKDGQFVVVAKAGLRQTISDLQIQWRPLNAHWFVSEKVTCKTVGSLARDIGFAQPTNDRLSDLSIEGGIKTERSSWLGRPNFLPRITASDQTEIHVESVGEKQEMLRVSGSAPSWRMESKTPISGRWRVTAREAASETEKIICLEADAPERWVFPEDLSLDNEIEIAVMTEIPEADFQGLSPKDTASNTNISDVVEAIYASPDRGWTESTLVPLVQQALGKEHLVWDLLRSFAEAGFLEPKLSRGWKARMWHLGTPTILALGKRTAMVEGAVGATALGRLSEEVASLRGDIKTLQCNPAMLAAPVILIENAAPVALSSSMNWPLAARTFPRIAAAPACWPPEPRSENGRFVAGSWCFERGLFMPRSSGQPTNDDDRVALTRLIREDGDDRDIFRVTGSGPTFLSSCRVTAIMEAYRRRKEPLFRWANGSLVRRSRGGHLPLPVARALRRRFLAPSGPVLEGDGNWTYSYRCDIQSAHSLNRVFGPIIEVPQQGAKELDLISRFLAARRSGGRLSWYAGNSSAEARK